MPGPDLLGGPPPTLLPADGEARAALDGGDDAASVAARWPSCCAAWATLAEEAAERDATIESYAYARTGYHRGLDQLRRAGWKGYGPVPYAHPGNRGFLRSLAALARAAGAIGEEVEAERCRVFLADCDPAAVGELLG